MDRDEVPVYISPRPGLLLETERLAVRPFTLDDVDGLLCVMSHAAVHSYTKDKGSPWDRPRTEAYIRAAIGMGSKALACFHGGVVEKNTGRLIGLCGLNPYEGRKPEIEFKLGVPYWGKGYATELGRQIIRGAFATAEIEGIYGIAQPENLASRRVLEKLGMGYLGERVFRGHKASFYYIPAYAKQPGAGRL